ncbi:MAG: hypothetical protein JNM76_02475 [Betaproteobacteria bacterium]|nr:hypothetical protein [Betaproteobacteria bacterium]
MKPIPIRIVLATLLSMFSLLAHADKTITFNVPVKLEKMDPLVNGVFVMCSVSGGAANPGWQIIKTSMATTTPVVNQAYTGIISVPLTIPTADLGKPATWSCALRLTTATTPTGVGLNTAGVAWSTVAAGSVGQVSGNF